MSVSCVKRKKRTNKTFSSNYKSRITRQRMPLKRKGLQLAYREVKEPFVQVEEKGDQEQLTQTIGETAKMDLNKIGMTGTISTDSLWMSYIVL